MTVRSPLIGEVLADRYRLEELIGRGGMSLVYRGFDLRLERPVAVKVFTPGTDDDVRWQTEVQLLSQLSHPHLVTLHDAHLEPPGSLDPSYLVMEYVPGTTLQQRLSEVGPSVALAGMVVEQVGEALAAVHARGIVHRDLKPGNILIEPSDLPPHFVRAKLADFGIAHLLGSDRVTRTGTMIGTAAYTSPEQVRGETATRASDVYSLGLVAIECATGRPAFGGTAAESLVARLTRDPDIPTEMDRGWRLLLASMTSRDPALRPSALDAAVHARQLPDGPPIAVAVSGSAVGSAGGTATQPMPAPTLLLPSPAVGEATELVTTPGPGAKRARPRRRRVAAVVAFGAVLLAGVVVGSAVAVNGLVGAFTPSTSSSSPSTQAPIPSTRAPTPTPLTTGGPGNGHGHGHGNGKNG